MESSSLIGMNFCVRDRWEILKIHKAGTETLLGGDMGNAIFQKSGEYILRVEMRGNALKFSLALDPVVRDGRGEFIDLGEVSDSTFRSGGVGLAVFDGKWAVFRDFFVKKL